MWETRRRSPFAVTYCVFSWKIDSQSAPDTLQYLGIRIFGVLPINSDSAFLSF